MDAPLKKNILLTGAPSSGKTTVIKKVIAQLPVTANGFYTEEERLEGRRTGFVLTTLEGKRGYLAHEDIPSAHHIRRYGVSLENIEMLAIPAITVAQNPVIILDEIGKMECFSQKFVTAAKKALDSSCIVVGTITLGGADFIQEVKHRDDVEILEVTPENRNTLPAEVLKRITALLAHR